MLGNHTRFCVHILKRIAVFGVKFRDWFLKEWKRFFDDLPVKRMRRAARGFLDSKSAFRRYHPAREGRADGTNNRPLPDETQLSPFELRVTTDFESALEMLRHATTRELVRAEQDFRDDDDKELASKEEFHHLIAEAKLGIAEVLKNQEEPLIKQKENELIRKREFIAFKQEHKRTNIPVDRSRVYEFGVFIGLIFVEGMINAFSFAQASELGLLGGFLKAVSISFVNVAFCFLVGSLLIRNFHHILWYRRVFSGLMFLASLYLIVVFHLLVGHYRDLLGIDPNLAMQNALNKFRSDPFGLVELESWVLVGLGLILGAFAMGDGERGSGDSYPGYAKVFRRYQKAQKEFGSEMKNLKKELKLVMEAAFSQVGQRVTIANANYEQFCNMERVTERLLQDYRTLYQTLQHVLHAVLKEYREENRTVRTAPEPEYFLTIQKLGGDLQYKDANLEEAKKDLVGQIQEIKAQAAEAREEIHKYYANELKNLVDFIKDIEGKAETRADRMNQLEHGALINRINIGDS